MLLLEQWIVILITFTIFAIYEIMSMRKRSDKGVMGSKRVFSLYFGMILLSVYLATDYGLELKLPHFTELIEFLFGDLSQMIVDALQTKTT